MTTENVTQNLMPTSQTASYRVLIAAALSALLLPIIYPLAANGTLPASDAATVKQLFFDTLRASLPVLLGMSGFGTVAGSLLLRGGKIAAQLAPGMVTQATPNGEGIGGATDVNPSAGSAT